MFVPSFLALWWPKIDRKSGFPQLFAKTVGSIHFIPGIYTYGVSLWTPIDFRVRALIFGPLVAKNWPKIGVSATFRENCRLDSFHPWDLYLWGKSLDPYWIRVRALIFGPLVAKNLPKLPQWLKIGLFVGYFLMGWVLIRAGVYCPHLWAQLVQTLFYYERFKTYALNNQMALFTKFVGYDLARFHANQYKIECQHLVVLLQNSV